MTGRVIHRTAAQLDATWIGRRITLTVPGYGTVTGGLSDLQQWRGRTWLFVAGIFANVPNTATITIDTLGVIGGQP